MSVISETECSLDVKDEEIEKAEVEKYRKARENEQFPDEMDTPVDTPARIRFQRYRALKSFRFYVFFLFRLSITFIFNYFTLFAFFFGNPFLMRS